MLAAARLPCFYESVFQHAGAFSELPLIGALGGSHSPGPVPVAATGVDRGRLHSGVAEAQNNRSRCAARRLYQPTMLATAINAPVMSTKEPPITWSRYTTTRHARLPRPDAPATITYGPGSLAESRGSGPLLLSLVGWVLRAPGLFVSQKERARS
jgi:hypothetical protein